MPALRQMYLNLTFKSFHAHVEAIAVCVCTDADAAFVAATGLPWFDVLRTDCHINGTTRGENFFKPSLLGVLTGRAVQAAFASRRWTQTCVLYTERSGTKLRPPPSLRYVLYTESDQVVYARSLHAMSRLASDTHYVAPHRLVPMPHPSAFAALESPGAVPERERARGPTRAALGEVAANGARRLASFASEHDGSCCLDAGQCLTRDHWKFWKAREQNADVLGLLRVEHSFPMVAGEGNFLRMQFRACEPSARVACAPGPPPVGKPARRRR